MDQQVLPGMERSEEGERRKREGMERVVRNESAAWRFRASAVVRFVALRMQEFTADDVMLEGQRRGLPPPHHQNVWGAIYRAAMDEGVMEKTGRYVKSTRPDRHRSVVPVYRSLIGPNS